MGLGFLIKERKCSKFDYSLDNITLNRYQVFFPSYFLETGSPKCYVSRVCAHDPPTYWSYRHELLCLAMGCIFSLVCSGLFF